MPIITRENFNKIKFKPLDVILFHGVGISTIISYFERCFNKNKSGRWSHCGIVVNKSICGIQEMDANEWYILESTYSGSLNSARGVPDIYGDKFLGVQIRNLYDVLHAYSKVGTFIGIASPKCELSNMDIYNFRDFVYTYYDAPYACCCLLKPLFPDCFPCRIRGCMFCSELVVRAFQRLGVLDKSIDPETIDPADILDLKFTEDVHVIEINGTLID